MIGCASGRVELDISHPEHLCGTRLTNNVSERQPMCCALLWLVEQLRIDDSMRVDIRFDIKYAAAAAWGHSVARRTLSWCTNSDITGIV